MLALRPPWPDELGEDMERLTHNRLRQLQGLVSIDAWYTRPNAPEQTADLHVYAFFDEARLGGRTEDQIAFRMVLRHAEIRVGQTEPTSFQFDPAAIWRGDDDTTGTVKRTETEQTETAKVLEGRVGVSTASLSAGGGGKAGKKQTRSLELETDQPLKAMSVSFSRHDRAMPTWILKPTGFRTHPEGIASLHGLPWPSDQQRLLRLARRSGHVGDDSDIRISVTCRREDLHFFDIHVRGGDGRFVPVEKQEPRRIAIEEYLRSALAAEGLPSPDMKSMFSTVTLGIVLAEPRRADDW